MIRGDGVCQDTVGFNKFFEVFSAEFISPRQGAGMEEFSESDLECLEQSIVENQDLSFTELKDKSHDQAYEKASKDDKIPFREIARVSGADETILEFMKFNSENESILDA